MKKENSCIRAQELCESRGGRPRLPVPNKPNDFGGRKAPRKTKICLSELNRCVKVEVAVQGFSSLISLVVSVDVKQH